MIRKFLSILMVLSLLLSFTACSSSDEPSDSAQSDGVESTTPDSQDNDTEIDTVYTMRIAHAQPVDNPRHISLEAFKEMVEEKTNGGITVELYPAGQLGNEREMLEQSASGVIEGFRGGQFDFLPKLLIFSLPFLFETPEEVTRLLNSDFARELTEESKEDGVMILGLGDAGGFRQYSNNRRPITKPEDLEGLRMRSNGMDTIDRTFEALGASVISVPYNDLYMGLRTGLADGQENPWVNISTMKFYEVQNYFTEINYQIHPDPFYVNLDWFNALPEEYQEILQDCTDEMMIINNQAILENEAAALAEIEANAEVYTLTEDERQAFVDAVQVVYDDYLAEGLITQEELDTMRAIIAGN
ncbi:C4-dicarboxylate-binding protein DctP [Natranaerovirga hydrolytica]|uniref:C4-dicarboxylate-binding protein DctP n=1 Tax=Natranaerovirga hydrolytica TaxID=680378 RepID=A0A4R1N1X4_9FIRM|nr:TRAP transporter substrate-binding protein [Natranaerovirga hydrolytica]TCL00068.1 C4-dicarboxylate-binding protein DctP [Natranaerovirga hydrolytica]